MESALNELIWISFIGYWLIRRAFVLLRLFSLVLFVCCWSGLLLTFWVVVVVVLYLLIMFHNIHFAFFVLYFVFQFVFHILLVFLCFLLLLLFSVFLNSATEELSKQFFNQSQKTSKACCWHLVVVDRQQTNTWKKQQWCWLVYI